MRFSFLWAAARILLAAGFTILVACALGRWFLRASGAWKIFSRGEKLLFAFGVGSAWLSSLVFLLCAARLAYPGVFLAVGAAAIWVGFRQHSPKTADETRHPVRGLWFLAPVAICYGYLYLMHAMAPETSPDGASYHLGLVSRYLRDHGFGGITTSIYAMLSQGMEMLFVFAFAFGRHSAAKLTHFAFLVATVAAMILFGRRFRLGPDGTPAAVGAAFFALSPVVGVDGTSSYNDCALAFFIFLTFYLLLIWDSERNAALWPAIGVAAGFCYAVKYTGFLALPFALAFLARDRPSWLSACRKVFLFAALFIAPWMLRNAIVTGNPVAPFFNRIFVNPYVHVSFEQTYAFLMRHYGGLAERSWSDYRQVPWELAVRGGKLQGLLGPVFLLAPLGLIALRQKTGRRLWIAAAVFALPWLSNIGTRFLIPSLVFASLAMALAIWQLPRKLAIALSALLVTGHAVACWPTVLDRWNHKLGWRLGRPPWRVALRLEHEFHYLAREMLDFNLAQLIERNVPQGARVFSCHGIAEAYTSREIIGTYQSALSEVLTDHLLAAFGEIWGPSWKIRLEWEPRPLAGLRLVQTGSHEKEQWSIHEMTFFSRDAGLLPKPSWLLRAQPNPWDAAMAMDSNLATRWRSWWPLYPGMRFQVDFPEPVLLSAVELRCSPDQYSMAIRAEGKDASGRWSPLEAETTRSDIEPPPQIKRLATREIKRRGVDYLLTNLDGSLKALASDIEDNPPAWGLRQVAEYGPIRLYHIE